MSSLDKLSVFCACTLQYPTALSWGCLSSSTESHVSFDHDGDGYRLPPCVWVLAPVPSMSHDARFVRHGKACHERLRSCADFVALTSSHHGVYYVFFLDAVVA